MFRGFSRNVGIALRLACFDASRAGDLPDNNRDFWLSFVAFPITILFAYIQNVILASSNLGLETAGAALSLKLTLIMAVVWLASLHLAAAFSEQFGREHAWVKFAIASNFCAIAQALITTSVMGITAVLGALPRTYDAATLILFLWSIAYDWYVARRILSLSKLQTTILICLELMLLLMLLSTVGRTG